MISTRFSEPLTLPLKEKRSMRVCEYLQLPSIRVHINHHADPWIHTHKHRTERACGHTHHQDASMLYVHHTHTHTHTQPANIHTHAHKIRYIHSHTHVPYNSHVCPRSAKTYSHTHTITCTQTCQAYAWLVKHRHLLDWTSEGTILTHTHQWNVHSNHSILTS